jgi:hypothetical protein
LKANGIQLIWEPKSSSFCFLRFRTRVFLREVFW